MLTISIATVNRSRFLFQLLGSIVGELDSFDGAVEVDVVVDSLEDQESLSVVNQFPSKYIRSFSQNPGGLSAARNLGAQVARGNFIRLQDDDDSLSKGAIKQLLVHHSNKPENIYLGKTILRNRQNEFMKWATEVEGFLFKYKGIRTGIPLGFQFFWGGRISLPTRYLLDCPFNEKLRFGAEDIEWGYKFQAKYPFQLEYTPKILGVMERELTLVDACFRSINQGWANGYLVQNNETSALTNWARQNSGPFLPWSINDLVDEISLISKNWTLHEISFKEIQYFSGMNSKLIQKFVYAGWWRLLMLCKALGFNCCVFGYSQDGASKLVEIKR
jgi:glycosyltransferase involved in cell wall biosynthesis